MIQHLDLTAFNEISNEIKLLLKQELNSIENHAEAGWSSITFSIELFEYVDIHEYYDFVIVLPLIRSL